jgi:hypothetical protein
MVMQVDVAMSSQLQGHATTPYNVPQRLQSSNTAATGISDPPAPNQTNKIALTSVLQLHKSMKQTLADAIPLALCTWPLSKLQ